MKQKISITVKGRNSSWSFQFLGDPKHLAQWRADGLEVAEVLNTVPQWAVQLGLLKPWVRIQDIWQLIKLW